MVDSVEAGAQSPARGVAVVLHYHHGCSLRSRSFHFRCRLNGRASERVGLGKKENNVLQEKIISGGVARRFALPRHGLRALARHWPTPTAATPSPPHAQRLSSQISNLDRLFRGERPERAVVPCRRKRSVTFYYLFFSNTATC